MDKEKFSDRLKKAMLERNIKQVELVQKMINIVRKERLEENTESFKSLVNRYVHGTIKTPRKPILSIIAKALDVNEDWLFGLDAPMERIEIDQNIKLIRPTTRSIKIPILGKIPAGIPIEAIEDIRGYEDIPSDWIKNGEEFFALYICGDSMMPDYHFGDIIIIKKQEDCNSGDDCAVMVNGDEAIFKRVIKNKDGIILKSLNSKYDPLFFSKEKIETTPVRILGVAIEVRRKLKH